MILSDYAKNKLLDLIFGGTAWSTKPGTLYFALFTSAPDDTGGGTEVSAGGYARVSKTVGGTDFEASTANGVAVTNKTAVQFPVATAAWGTVTHWGVYDASTGGNLIFWGPLPASLVIAINQTASWAVGNLSFDVGGACGDWLGKILLNYLFIGTALPTIAAHYFALGTGASESGISGEPAIATNAYARKSMTNQVATYAAAAAGAKSNAALIQFAAASGGAWAGVLTHMAILSAGGVSATVTASSSSGLLLTTGSAHNLAVGDIVRFGNSGGALPVGLAANTDYYVEAIPLSTTFRVSTTAGGAAIAYTDAGSGTNTVYPQTLFHFALDSSISVASGDQPQFAAGALALELD